MDMAAQESTTTNNPGGGKGAPGNNQGPSETADTKNDVSNDATTLNLPVESGFEARGFNWRDGHNQYNAWTMCNAVNMDTTITRKLINQQSSSSKFGRRVGFKREFPELLRLNLTNGDYSQGKRDAWEWRHRDPGASDYTHKSDGNWESSCNATKDGTLAPDFAVESFKEVQNRMGDQIYGYQVVDVHKVGDEVEKHNPMLVGGQNMGFGSYDCGLWQAGYARQAWEKGPEAISEYNNNPNVINGLDHVRASTISQPLKSYAPEQLWIGSGHAPGSKHMRQLPFFV